MGNPLSKASEGGDCDILGGKEVSPKVKSSMCQKSTCFPVQRFAPACGRQAEAFPTGSPTSVCGFFLHPLKGVEDYWIASSLPSSQ
jgi:hypothetical protein